MTTDTTTRRDFLVAGAALAAATLLPHRNRRGQTAGAVTAMLDLYSEPPTDLRIDLLALDGNTSRC
jgi:hypothetical protein